MKALLDSKRVSMASTDRRRHKRYRFSAPITVRCADGSEKAGMTLEISENGMSVILADPLLLGETVQLEPVAGTRVSALVRHHVGKVHGVEFLDLTDGQVQKIRASCSVLPIYRPKNLNI